MCLFRRSSFHPTIYQKPDWWIVLLEGSLLSTEELWKSDRVAVGFTGSELLLRTADGASSKLQTFTVSLRRQSCLRGLQTVPLTSCFVCALMYASGKQATPEPFQTRCNHFTTGRLRESCTNISAIFSGNRMNLSFILSVTEKAVNTSLHVISIFVFLMNLQKPKKNPFFVVIMGFFV